MPILDPGSLRCNFARRSPMSATTFVIRRPQLRT